MLGLINADGLTPDNAQKLDLLIQQYRMQYRNLVTEAMLHNAPKSVKSNPIFQAGLKNWQFAYGRDPDDFIS